MDSEYVGKASKENYDDGKLIRMQFRKDFEILVKELHSAVLVCHKFENVRCNEEVKLHDKIII